MVVNNKNIVVPSLPHVEIQDGRMFYETLYNFACTSAFPKLGFSTAPRSIRQTRSHFKEEEDTQVRPEKETEKIIKYFEEAR